MKPTGTLIHRDGGAELELKRRFDAPVTTVWEAITESDRLSAYIGHWSGDPASGVVTFQMNAEGEVPPEHYHILEVHPPRKLVVQLGESPDDIQPVGDDDIPHQPWIVELNLIEADGRTTLALRQQIENPDMAPEIAVGWEYYLDRMVAAEHGESAEEISFEPYEAMAPAYRDLLN